MSSSKINPLGPDSVGILDLQTGQEQTALELRPSPVPRHKIANNGTVLLGETVQTGPRLRSWPGGEERVLPVTFATGAAQLNASATHILFARDERMEPGKRYLYSLDLKTDRETWLLTFYDAFDMSDDGEVIAYLDADRRPWTVRRDGSGHRRLFEGPEFFSELRLSGDGNVLYAATGSRILRFDLRTNVMREIAGPARRLSARPIASSARVVPGSVYEWRSGLPLDIGELRLLNRPLQILSADNSRIFFQVPYDMPDGTGWPELVLKEQPGSDFVSSVTWSHPVQVMAYSPSFYRRDRYIAALHKDSTPITPANPARSGQVVSLFGYGFGPVSPEPPTGEPASANPLSILVTPMTCRLESPREEALDVLYAGLAPGWVGLYQFDVRLPTSLPAGEIYISCTRSSDPPHTIRAVGAVPAEP